MTIDVSGPARRYVESRSGQLFVYFRDVGRWSTQRVATRRPDGVEFEEHDVGSIRLWLQAGFAPPALLKVRRRPWPLGPIEVLGTGVERSSGAEALTPWPTDEGHGQGGWGHGYGHGDLGVHGGHGGH